MADLIAGRGAMEGWWNALAIVSAYFSTFEHILIGCLPPACRRALRPPVRLPLPGEADNR
jgi:hypothetical protein